MSQQQPQQQEEGVVIDVNGNARSQGGNSTRGGHGPQQYRDPSQVIAAEKIRWQKPDYKAVVDISSNEGMSEFMARLAEANGFHAQAAAMRGGAADKGLSAMFGRTMEHRIRVKDVATVILVGAALFLIYEGVAYKFDLPRVGVFDPKDPLKSAKK